MGHVERRIFTLTCTQNRIILAVIFKLNKYMVFWAFLCAAICFSSIVSKNCVFISCEVQKWRVYSTSQFVARVETVVEHSVREFILSAMKNLPLGEIKSGDIDMQRLPNVNTNNCWKCSVPSNGRSSNQSFFVKHAETFSERYLNHRLNPQRISFDYEGLKAFSTYASDFLPVVYAYDPENCILITEYLDRFQPIQRLFESGDVPTDVSRFISTVMGRNHGRTHRAAVSPGKRSQYSNSFANEHQTSLWKTEVENVYAIFRTLPIVDTGLSLEDPFSLTPLEVLQQLNGPSSEQTEGIFLRSVRLLSDRYVSKMETLIHGELDSSNILFRQKVDADDLREGPASVLLKVIDFEGCRYGAAGADMGAFIGSYATFFVAHSLSAPRRNLLSQIAAAVDAYKVAFRIQFESTRKANIPAESSRRNADEILNSIVADSVGFAGLHVLFHALEVPLSKKISLERVPGCAWGDAEGKQRSVRRRMVHTAGRLLQLFLQYRDVRDDHSRGDTWEDMPSYVPSALNVESILQALRADDALLLSDHYTEFWT